MSLSRAALRLAAIEALAPAALVASSAPLPTCAGANIFDSRVEPVAAADDWETFVAGLDDKPLAIVYTEEQDTEPKPGSDYHAEVEIIDLVVELMIASRGEIDVQKPDGTTLTIGAVAAPVTDRQREATLDLLEGQIRRLLDPRQNNSAGNLYRKIAWELRHVHSVPQRSAEGAAIIAARTCKFKIKVASTEWPQIPVTPAPTGVAGLPEPLLTVAQALPVNSSGYATCLAIAGLIAPPDTLPPLTDIRIAVDVSPPTLTQTVAAVEAFTTPASVTADVTLTGLGFDALGETGIGLP